MTNTQAYLGLFRRTNNARGSEGTNGELRTNNSGGASKSSSEHLSKINCRVKINTICKYNQMISLRDNYILRRYPGLFVRRKCLLGGKFYFTQKQEIWVWGYYFQERLAPPVPSLVCSRTMWMRSKNRWNPYRCYKFLIRGWWTKLFKMKHGAERGTARNPSINRI